MFHTQDALFAENAGQWAVDDVYFGYNKGGTQIYFTDDGLEFELCRSGYDPAMDLRAMEPVIAEAGLQTGPRDNIESTHFSLAFDGARATMPVGADRTETVFNYHLGEDANWVDSVATYKTVVYNGLYDGIDLHTFSRHGQMKYEFHIEPGSDYTQIELSYGGIEKLSIAADGSLHIATELGEIVDEDLYIYQVVDGQEIEVVGQFVLLDEDSYAFNISGEYDASAELIIDPNIDWGTYLGGSDSDSTGNVATDAQGNIYACGSTRSSGWGISVGWDTTYGGNSDGYVVKLTSSGAHLWSTYLGGSNDDYATGVTTDIQGDIYVTGFTSSSDWGITGGWDTSYGGGRDGYIVKLTDTGLHIWSTFLGGSDIEGAYIAATDVQGNVYVCGDTASSDWGISGGWDTTYGGGFDGYVIKLTSGGSHLWSTYLGGAGADCTYHVATDPQNNIYVSGYRNGDGYVDKFSGSGSHLWSTYLGGTDNSFATEVITDGEGNVYVCGSFDGNVAKLSSVGTRIWSVYLDGVGEGISMDGQGNVYVCGRTDASGGYITKLSSGGSILWEDTDQAGLAWGVTTDDQGNVYVCGSVNSISSNIYGGWDTTFGGNGDGFVLKINDLSRGGAMVTVESPGGARVEGAAVNLYYDTGNGWTFYEMANNQPSSGVAGFNSIPARAYNFEVYYEGEFWGSAWTAEGAMTVPVLGLGTCDIVRHEPYAFNVRLEVDGQSVVGGEVPLGETIDVAFSVTNDETYWDTDVGNDIWVQFWLDKVPTEPAAEPFYYSTDIGQEHLVAGQWKEYSAEWTPSEAGEYLRRIEVYTWINEHWVLTDLWDWQEVLTVYEPFEPYVAGFTLHGIHDNDKDGLHSRLELGVNVDSNVEGECFVRLYDEDLASSNDFIVDSSSFPVNGQSTNDAFYVSFDVTSNWYEVPWLDIFSLYIELYDADTGQMIQGPVHIGSWDIETVEDDTPEWAILAYFDGDNNLEPYFISYLDDLENAAGNEEVVIAAQLDRSPGWWEWQQAELVWNDDTSHDNWTDTRRFLVEHDTSGTSFAEYSNYSIGEANMGDSAVLQSFIEWGIGNLPDANNYALILGDHGLGWPAICMDNTDDDFLTMPEIVSAVSDADVHFDTIFLNACLMGGIEVASYLDNISDYLVFSEDEMWGILDTLFTIDVNYYYDFASHISESTTSQSLAGSIALNYYQSCTAWWQDYDMTISTIDCSQVDAVLNAVDFFADSIIASQDAISDCRSAVIASTSFCSNPDYTDLYEIAEAVFLSSSDPQVQLAAATLCAAIDNLVLENYTNGINEDAKGISVYLPNPRYDSYWTEYKESEFAAIHRLDELAIAMYGEPDETPPEAVFLPTVSTGTGQGLFLREIPPTMQRFPQPPSEQMKF